MGGALRQRSLVASMVAFGLALVLPLAVLSAITTSWYVSTERARLEAVARLSGDHLRERLDRDLAERIAIARTLATSPAIDAGDLAGFGAQARALVAVKDGTVVLAELDGRHLVNTYVEPGGAMPFVPRPEIAARLLATRKPIVSKVVVSGLTGNQIVLISVPVIRNDAVAKLVTIIVSMQLFAPLIERQHLAEPYSATILDGAGRVVARSGATAQPPLEAYRQQPGTERSLAGWDVEGTSTLDVVHRSDLSDWTVVTGIDRKAFEAPLRRSLTILGILAVVLVCLGGAIAWSYGRRAAAAAANLTAAAEAIGRGAPVAVQPTFIREANLIGDALAAASRLLAEQRGTIAEAQARLEDRVAERTRELAASRAHYRLLAENMTDVVVLRRAGGGPSYVSPSIAGLLGHAGEFCAFDAGRDVHPDDLAGLEAVERTIGPDCPSIVSSFRLRHADGRWIWIEAVHDFLPDAGASESNVISTLRDITVRREQADELRMARDAAELAQGRAESMNRAKSAFIGLMSHEIRTPLTTIKGFADLLADGGGLSREQRRRLGLITGATETLLVAVDDILDFVRAETGELRIEASPFALARTLTEVTELVRPAAADRRIGLVRPETDDLDGLVVGDERRLRQILVNLLNDAIGTTRGGDVTLAARRPRAGETPGTVRFSLTASLRDDGAEHRPARTEALVGSGLGVRIAERLVGLMGGRIDRTTRLGEAAAYRFTLSLPPARARPLVEADIPSLRRSARLLVADDGAGNREIVRAMLEGSGYRVDTVDDGEAAIAAVQAQTYDLVLISVTMQGTDGFATTRRIRALQHPSRRVPIVAMTANAMPDQIRAFAQAGMNGHIAKPFDRPMLCEVVARRLSSLVLLDTGGAGPRPSRPAVFHRAAYDALRASLGYEAAGRSLNAFVGLLGAFEDAGGTGTDLGTEAASVAAAAERLGFLDIADAYGLLATASVGAEAEIALLRCVAARDLAQRTLQELTSPERLEVGPHLALL